MWSYQNILYLIAVTKIFDIWLLLPKYLIFEFGVTKIFDRFLHLLQINQIPSCGHDCQGDYRYIKIGWYDIMIKNIWTLIIKISWMITDWKNQVNSNQLCQNESQFRIKSEWTLTSRRLKLIKPSTKKTQAFENWNKQGFFWENVARLIFLLLCFREKVWRMREVS